MTPAVLLLFVEDEALITETMSEALTDAGFGVSAAADGSQALVELGNDAARFRAVITDIRLGSGPNGWDVARRARELVHDVPIIYISGDSAGDWSSKGVPNSLMISKPSAPAQLITAVSTLLNKAGTQRALAD